MLDYIVAILLLACPWIFNFNNAGAQTYVPVVLGILTILYSLITNYEYSLTRIIPFKTHLLFDLISGFFLAASPWLFGFHQTVYLPHLVFGILELAVVALSEKTVRSLNQKSIMHNI